MSNIIEFIQLILCDNIDTRRFIREQLSMILQADKHEVIIMTMKSFVSSAKYRNVIILLNLRKKCQ